MRSAQLAPLQVIDAEICKIHAALIRTLVNANPSNTFKSVIDHLETKSEKERAALIARDEYANQLRTSNTYSSLNTVIHATIDICKSLLRQRQILSSEHKDRGYKQEIEDLKQSQQQLQDFPLIEIREFYTQLSSKISHYSVDEKKVSADYANQLTSQLTTIERQHSLLLERLKRDDVDFNQEKKAIAKWDLNLSNPLQEEKNTLAIETLEFNLSEQLKKLATDINNIRKYKKILSDLNDNLSAEHELLCTQKLMAFTNAIEAESKRYWFKTGDLKNLLNTVDQASSSLEGIMRSAYSPSITELTNLEEKLTVDLRKQGIRLNTLLNQVTVEFGDFNLKKADFANKSAEIANRIKENVSPDFIDRLKSIREKATEAVRKEESRRNHAEVKSMLASIKVPESQVTGRKPLPENKPVPSDHQPVPKGSLLNVFGWLSAGVITTLTASLTFLLALEFSRFAFQQTKKCFANAAEEYRNWKTPSHPGLFKPVIRTSERRRTAKVAPRPS